MFTKYEQQPGDVFDFSSFNKLERPRPIARFVKLLQKGAIEGAADKVVILTARAHTLPVTQFLRMIGIKSGVVVAALADANPQRKTDYIEKQIQSGYNRILFVDDSEKNVNAVNKLKEKYPDVKLVVHRAQESPESKTLQPTLELRPITGTKDPDFRAVDYWIKNKHYRGKWPRSVQQVLGVYLDGRISGVLVYGIGSRPQSTEEIFQNPDGSPVMGNNQMWELQRSFTTDEAKALMPNLGSMVIGRGNEYIRTHAKTKDGLPVRAIISYADSSVGHEGTVYKASNALYLGIQRPYPYYLVTNPETGETEKVDGTSREHLKKAAALGYKIEKKVPKTGKHKFVYVLGTPQEKKALMSKIVKPLFSYPSETEPPKQIPNPAKTVTPQQPARNEPDTKTGVIKKLLQSKVKNPETGNDILVRTALTYDKNHPSYRQAKGMLMAYGKRHNIKLRPSRLESWE